MTTAQRLLALLAAVSALTAVAQQHEQDVHFLTNGVEVIDASGIPGPVCGFGDDAFAVVVGKDKSGARLPVVVASRYGRGRVVALGKDGFLDAGNLDKGDTGRMLVNAVTWAGGQTTDRAVGVFRHDGLAEALSERGLPAKQINLDQLADIDVLLLTPDHAEMADIDRLKQFVAEGGGLVTGALGWGWSQLNPGKTLSEDMVSNRLLAPMGIVYLDGTLGRTAEDGYRVDGVPSELTNASVALDAALAHSAGETELTGDRVTQVSTVLSRVAQVLPRDDTMLLPRLQKLHEDETVQIVPSPEDPVTTDEILSRIVLTMQVRDAKHLPPAKLKAHPAAATFPGSVPNDAPRVTHKIRIDTNPVGWHGTGLYAPPGQVIDVALPPDAATLGLKLRIGSTTCKNWHHSRWLRAPEVTRSFTLDEPHTKVANAFGGLIYIVVPASCQPDDVSVTLSNVVEAPHFVLGRTALKQWQETIRNRPAPRAELASDKAVLMVPAENVRELDNPAALLRVWERVLDYSAELAARESTYEKRPQRYCADVQICAGYMHAGNPIMLPVSAAPKLLDINHLLNEGNWGLYHETGHMHQEGDWTFGGTGEVTVNLFTLYVYDRLCGKKLDDTRMSRDHVKQIAGRHILRGADFDRWKSKPFLALAMYVQLIDEFGWEPFKTVFAEYRRLPDSDRPKTDHEKRDQWMVRFSRAIGKNLGPFFEVWGVPTSEDARKSIAQLPEWMPDDFPPEDPRKHKIASKAEVISFSSENTPDGYAANAVDGFTDTIWHSKWRGDPDPQHPHEIVIDLHETMDIKGLTYLPRQTGENGWISQCEVYISADTEKWGQPVGTGAFEKGADSKNIVFDQPVTGRYIRFVATEGFDGQPWASVAELDVIPAE